VSHDRCVTGIVTLCSRQEFLADVLVLMVAQFRKFQLPSSRFVDAAK
jgi:hypothetical protein